MTVGRRQFLATFGGMVSLSGCASTFQEGVSTYSPGREKIEGSGGNGSWPMPGYDSMNRSYNPETEPLRSKPQLAYEGSNTDVFAIQDGYVYFGTNSLEMLNPHGDRLILPQYSVSSPLIVNDSHVFLPVTEKQLLQDRSSVIALDNTTGEKSWKTNPYDDGGYNGMRVLRATDNHVLVYEHGPDKAVYSMLDSEDGEILWLYSGGPWLGRMDPIMTNEIALLFVDRGVIAKNIGSGNFEWAVEVGRSPNFLEALSDRDYCYIMLGNRNGDDMAQILKINNKNGEVIYTKELGLSGHEIGSACLTNSYLYLPTSEGILKIAAKTGDVVDIILEQLNSPVQCKIAGDFIYVGEYISGEKYKISAVNDEVHWSLQINKGGFFAVADERLYTANPNMRVYTLQ